MKTKSNSKRHECSCLRQIPGITPPYDYSKDPAFKKRISEAAKDLSKQISQHMSNKKDSTYFKALRLMVKNCDCQPDAPSGCKRCASQRKILKMPFLYTVSNTFGG